MQYFTSDFHFAHENSAKARGFNSSEAHDSTIFENMFRVLKRGDILYNLGDWGMSKKAVPIITEFYNKLYSAGITLQNIWGNHDDNAIRLIKHKVITWSGDLKEVKIEHQPITLCHYPMYVYNRSHYNAFQIFGHIHNSDGTDKKLRANPIIQGKKINVNVDMNNMLPLSFTEIKDYMDTQPDNWDFIEKG